jgi:ABC-type multidrug transport system fused ATPase/permease subunit
MGGRRGLAAVDAMEAGMTAAPPLEREGEADEREWVLEDVSFTVEPGQTVAIVGATGAGKTTIISLLTRLYDIQRGRILVDGMDIREMDLHRLRSSVGVVLQDVFLFTGTIRQNIGLGEERIDDERIRAAARHVNAAPFIERLEDGYDSEVLERGATLSVGQRQLLAFARALAFDPAILVLDEATSSVDTETEALIQDALDKLMADRTTIVIAHRLSTIQKADRIIVLHRGRVREVGTHRELLEQRGFYHRLYRLQYQAEDRGSP